MGRRLALLSVLAIAACGDDLRPNASQLVVEPAIGLHTSEAGGQATFTVRLGGAPWTEIDVAVASSNPAEGTAAPSALAFDNTDWDQPQIVTVTGVDDLVADGPQPYVVALVPSGDPELAEVDVALTNDDDDTAGIVVTPTSDLTTTESGGRTSFTIALRSQPVADVTIPVASDNTDEGTLDRAAVVFTAATWNAPQAVTITGVDDGIPDGDVAYQIATGPSQSSDPDYDLVRTPTVRVENLGRALRSIELSPGLPSIALGTTQQMTATGIYDDGSTGDLTAQVTWGSTDGAVATIAAGGLATSHQTGSTSISASFAGKGDTTLLTVTPAVLAAIQIVPTDPSIAKGTTQAFAATGVYTDGTTQDLTTQVTWSSSLVGVATIDATGLASGTGVGQTTIGASFGGMQGTTTLTVTAAQLVSIQVTPTDPSIAKGTQQAFAATGLYTDNSTQDLTAAATWTSSLTGVATIVAGGVATGAGIGTTTITAQVGAIAGSTTLTVSAAQLASIQVTPTDPSAAKGTTVQFTATGVYTDATTQNLTTQVAWSSSSTGVATISNAAGSQGLARAVALGSSTIGATFGGISGSTTMTVTAAKLVAVEVSPINPTMARGTTLDFACTGVFSDNTTQDLTASALWASSNTSVATVSNAAGSKGQVTAVAIGSATISCKSGTLSDTSIVTVTAGSIVSITVTPATTTIPKGLQLQFTATVLYSSGLSEDITDSATWTSTATAVATISNQADFEGLATAVGVGSTTIGASFGGSSGSTTLSVDAATISSLAIVPASPSIAAMTSIQLAAIGTFSDGTQHDVTSVATWQSSDGTVATVSNASGSEGVAAGVAPGTTQIAASYQGQSANSALTVTAATLVSIAIAPADATMADGTQLQLTATGTFSDGSTQDLTTQVTWGSSNKLIVKVSNAPREHGRASALATGTVTVTAASLGVTGTTSLTVQ